MLAILFFIFILLAIFPTFDWRDHRGEFQIKCQIELASLGTALDAYQSKYSVFPKGNAVEIVKALLGDNPKRIKFINIGANNLSATGEFLDPWKTPFAIKFSPTNSFILSSAGKDKIWGSKDDIIFDSILNNFVKP